MQNTSSVEAALKDTYRQMVKTMPFDKITVIELCRRSNVSRKTFYEYFSDKDALLERILYDDLTQNQQDLKPLFANSERDISSPLLYEKMYRNVLDQREFYEALVSKGNAQSFIHTAMRCFIRLHKHLSHREGLAPTVELDYAARFGAGAGAAILVKWVRDGFTVTPRDLAKWVSDWGMSSSSVGFLP